MWYGNISLISCFSTIAYLVSCTCISSQQCWCLNNDIWSSAEKLLLYEAWMFRAASVLPIWSSWGKDFNGRKNRTRLQDEVRGGFFCRGSFSFLPLGHHSKWNISSFLSVSVSLTAWAINCPPRLQRSLPVQCKGRWLLFKSWWRHGKASLEF